MEESVKGTTTVFRIEGICFKTSEFFQAGMFLSVVVVGIDRDKNFRFDLPKPVMNPADAKIREQDDQTAPSDALASAPITASGQLATTAATRSPFLLLHPSILLRTVQLQFSTPCGSKWNFSLSLP